LPLDDLRRNFPTRAFRDHPIHKDCDVRIEEAKRGAEILGCELKVLMDDGPRGIEDINTCELV